MAESAVLDCDANLANVRFANLDIVDHCEGFSCLGQKCCPHFLALEFLHEIGLSSAFQAGVDLVVDEEGVRSRTSCMQSGAHPSLFLGSEYMVADGWFVPGRRVQEEEGLAWALQ